MFRHVLLATDLTAASAPAERTAAELATTLGARLTVVHVCEAPAFALAGTSETGADLLGPCTDGPGAALARVKWNLRKRAVEAEAVVRVGVPWEQILAAARELRADVIVTGTHGRHGLARALHGSVAERVVQESPVPVLAVPRAPDADA